MISYRSLAIASLSLAAVVSAPAFAQEAQSNDGADEGDDSIVVVGTLIRGSETIGAQTLTVTPEALTAKAANSTNELLALVPQISNTFNGRFEGDPRGVSAGISITKPNLRGLPGANASSGGTTLVILDGFRFTPVGVNQSSIDVDIIPAAVLSGMDVITDGGTSLYGADAVAGVINFRTMRKFEGIKVDANYGMGTTIKNFDQWDAQLTVGKSWSTGNAYISGGYASRDSVLNNETSWAGGQIFSPSMVPSFTGTQCNTPVGTETRWKYVASAGGVWTNDARASGAGTFAVGTACDSVGPSAYLAGQKRYNVFGQVTNDFSDTVSLRMTAYYTKRDQSLPVFPRGVTSAGSGITSGSQVLALYGRPAFNTIQAITEGIGFSLAPNAAYVNTPSKVGFETWGVTPELTVKLGSDWQVRTTAHFGRSFNYQKFPGINTVLAQCYITGCTAAASPTGAAIAAGQLNPLNAAAASAAVITDLIDYENAQETEQQLFVARTVADGPLFALPGGDAKVAVGAEYQDNQAKSHLLAGRVDAVKALPWQSYGRHAYSLFGELSLPVLTFLDLSASVRHDKYSDFGSTTNPNFGATLKPTNWLKIFGHWNKSFNAPTAVDGLGLGVGRFAAAYGSSRPYDPYTPKKDNGLGTFAMIAEGVKAGIKPQTAESWAIGLELTPLEGLRVGGEFYSIDFRDVLGAVNPQNLNTYITNPDLYIYNAQLTGPATTSGFANLYEEILASLTNGAALKTQQSAGSIGLFVDRRTSNIGSAKLQGVDFHVYYDAIVGNGNLSLGLAGTKTTKSTANFGVPTDELGNGGPEFTFISFVGYKTGGFSSRLTWNYSGSYKDSAPNVSGLIGQAINPFQTFNLALGYEFGESAGALSGTTLRLNVDNMFDAKPQITPRGQANLVTYAGWTLGRMLKMGISKKF
ncbi:TonB-dependent receptor domain-containing protein [Novosphingobium sp. TH158]|uniref:TonB-dependent receptor domain-containing protein n=1 Tax=Novosphingobium sp. TH158 TaxID=2067455 RepID=UPI001304074F|nr:TonB-dependent receptor [Novosphingobium sp. TH158]